MTSLKDAIAQREAVALNVSTNNNNNNNNTASDDADGGGDDADLRAGGGGGGGGGAPTPTVLPPLPALPIELDDVTTLQELYGVTTSEGDAAR